MVKTKISNKNFQQRKRLRLKRPKKKIARKNRTKDESAINQIFREEYLSEIKSLQAVNRCFILVGFMNLVGQINQQTTLPENFIFSAIALFDKYLGKNNKYLSKNDMIRCFFACLDLLDKEQNIGVFTSPFFKKYFNYKIEYKILDILNLKIYPKKMYDYFSKFYYNVYMKYQENNHILDFLNVFKKAFLEISFFFLFYNETIDKKPYENFIYCLLYSFEKAKELMPTEAECIENYISQFKDEFINYSEMEFNNIKKLIKESFILFNNLLLYNKKE